MNLQLISHTLCPFVHRAAIMLREKGVHFERTNIDLANKPDWFLAISPRGKVPVVVADGVPLFESMAINEFLDETHPPAMLPADPFARARQRAWALVADDLLGAQYHLFVAHDRAGLDRAAAGMSELLASYEAGLTEREIDEDGFDLAHVAVAPAMQRFILLEDQYGESFLEEVPRVRAWARKLAVRPSVVTTLPEGFDQAFADMLARARSPLVS